ncbi:MAG: CT583 family protein [Simkaniaceae bacterium]|nr:CT583 family protein [Candidatus Sacchlamyda saccharinae]
MVKVNDLLAKRFKGKTKKATRVGEITERSSFAGVFRIAPLTENEEETLRNLLKEYAPKKLDPTADLPFLSTITSEVKAINNQAAILHGERIKRAQEILKKYRDGAFSAWLISAYGNRQTPYNFLQYHEFYNGMNKALQDKVDTMPRQAVYTLATRDCPKEEKEEIVENYRGEGKKELLKMIRDKFPLKKKDKRAVNTAEQIIKQLLLLDADLSSPSFRPSSKQKLRIKEVLQSISQKL